MAQGVPSFTFSCDTGAGCPDHLISGSVSLAGSKPVANLSASYTQPTLLGHPAQVVFSATLTKK
ncbi:MAG TPA: hypothetical protein VLH09_09310 [Bryobacteraceae bacterium]|nr:hypothetical protein [Bryobacteraceae bacterium]